MPPAISFAVTIVDHRFTNAHTTLVTVADEGDADLVACQMALCGVDGHVTACVPIEV